MKGAVDDLFEELGNPGRVQVFLFILLGFNYFPVVWTTLIMAVFGSEVSFYCDVRSSGSILNDSRSANTSAHLQDTCFVSVEGMSNQTQPCRTGWVYDTTEVSMVTEWDLVCENEYKVALSTSIFFAGSMVGGLVVSYLSDYLGRRPVILTALYTQFVIGVGLFFVPSYMLYLVLRFCQGVIIQGLQITSLNMAMEWFRPAHRSVVGAGVEIFWGVSYIALAGIWYLIQDWRYIQLTVTLPFALTIAYIWVLPESVRWLLSKNKFDQADVVVQRIVKYNSIPYPKTTFNRIKNQATDKVTKVVNYTVLDIFRTPVIRRRSLILFYVWFSASVVYYGLSLGVTQLGGNKFLNFFISGAVELPAYVGSIFVLRRYGRRVPMSVCFILCGLTCIGSGLIHSQDPVRKAFSLALTMFGKFCAAGLFAVIFMYAAELYPTVIRNIGCGACAAFLRAGGLTAPQMLTIRPESFKQLPVVIFGGFALLAGALGLLLPETLNTNLPDQIEDVERLSATTERNENNVVTKL